MKHIIIIIASLISLSLFGQNQPHYADGVTQLEADKTFGSGTNWHELFSDFNKKIYDRPVGKYRKISVDNQGNIYMTQKTNYHIYKFSSDGEKIKNIGSHGTGDGQFPMLPTVCGVIDNKHVYTTDVQGRVRLFDLNGTFYKNEQIDYMPLNCVALKNNKIAILGHVPMGGGDVKNIISIKDLGSGKEQIVWKNYRTRKQSEEKNIVIDLGKKGMISFSQIFSHPSYFHPHISSTNNGNLIVGFPQEGKIEVFDYKGEKLKSFSLDIEPLKITKADMQEYYDAAIKKAKEVEKSIKNNERYNEKEKKQIIDGYNRGVEMLKDPNYYPSNLPYFAEILVDDKNNLWVVKYAEQAASESFQMYAFSSNGKYLGTSKIQCDDYKVVLDPDQIQFYNGKMIAVVLDKNDKKMPLRLMKFNLQ